MVRAVGRSKKNGPTVKIILTPAVILKRKTTCALFVEGYRVFPMQNPPRNFEI